jgi:hypothetical protein
VPPSTFNWEEVIAFAAGGGQSAVLTRERHSLRARCESVLLGLLSAHTCAPLLEAATRTHCHALMRECLACVEQHGARAIAEHGYPPSDEAGAQLERLERCVAEARDMLRALEEAAAES